MLATLTGNEFQHEALELEVILAAVIKKAGGYLEMSEEELSRARTLTLSRTESPLTGGTVITVR